jgi:Periplasmic glycine betaine/choline-binding (lipo)protein of an ABC-type transport system (osmoprotectant binding protein)
MRFFRKKIIFKASFALLCIPLLVLAACGANAGSGTATGSSNSKGVTLTVGGKLDGESQLLTKLYTLVLRNAGYTVNEKPAFGDNAIVFAGIKSGALDLYPEYTATGLDALGKKSSLNDQQDYDTVKAGFKQQFNIDWLNYAPLNDTYAICMQKSEAQSLNIKTISDLAAKAPQLTFDLPSDSAYVFDYLKPKYNNLSMSSFKALHKVDYAIGFKELSGGQTQAAFCYSTDIGIVTNNFVVLTDNNHAFPAYHPAPIVRASVLAKNPDIATVLNKLSPYLTTDASLQLQKAVLDDTNQGMSNAQAVTQAATQFLQKNKLIS